MTAMEAIRALILHNNARFRSELSGPMGSRRTAGAAKALQYLFEICMRFRLIRVAEAVAMLEHGMGLLRNEPTGLQGTADGNGDAYQFQ